MRFIGTLIMLLAFLAAPAFAGSPGFTQGGPTVGRATTIPPRAMFPKSCTAKPSYARPGIIEPNTFRVRCDGQRAVTVHAGDYWTITKRCTGQNPVRGARYEACYLPALNTIELDGGRQVGKTERCAQFIHEWAHKSKSWGRDHRGARLGGGFRFRFPEGTPKNVCRIFKGYGGSI